MSIEDLAGRIAQARKQLEQNNRLTERLRELEPSVKIPPGRHLDREERKEFWLKSALNPNSPLLPPERKEILDRYEAGEDEIAPRDERVSARQRSTAYQGSHEPKPRREEGDEMIPRTRIEHALRDPYAYRFLSSEEKDLASSIVSSPESDQYYSEDLQAHRQKMRDRYDALSPAERAEVDELRDRRREEFWDREDYRDHDPRFNDPSSQPEDNRPSPPEDNRPSPPEDNRSGGSGLGGLFGGRRRP